MCVRAQFSVLPDQLLSATSELVRARGVATDLAREKAKLQEALNVAKVRHTPDRVFL